MTIDYIQNKENIDIYRKKIVHYLEDDRLRNKISSNINFKGINVSKAFEIILKHSDINYYKIKFNMNDVKNLNKYCSELFLSNIYVKAGLMVCEVIQILISWLNLLKNGAIYSFYYDVDNDIHILEISNM